MKADRLLLQPPVRRCLPAILAGLGAQSFGDVVATGPCDVAALMTTSVSYPDDATNPVGFNNRSGTPAVDFSVASDLAGVPLTSLDVGGSSYEGSAIGRNFVATAGDILTITFDWVLLTTEPAGTKRNPNFGFLAINDTVVNFVDTNASSFTGNFAGTFSYTPSSGGVVSLVLRVVDIKDTLVTSELRFGNINAGAVSKADTFA